MGKHCLLPPIPPSSISSPSSSSFFLVSFFFFSCIPAVTFFPLLLQVPQFPYPFFLYFSFIWSFFPVFLFVFPIFQFPFFLILCLVFFPKLPLPLFHFYVSFIFFLSVLFSFHFLSSTPHPYPPVFPLASFFLAFFILLLFISIRITLLHSRSAFLFSYLRSFIM